MKHQHSGFAAARLTPLLLLALAACGGSSGTTGSGSVNDPKLTLQTVQYGRLVDVYAYQVIDPAGSADRRDRFNRQPVRIAKDVVISPFLETQSLYDAGGEEVPSANYQFLSFDIATGHEELMILWDNRGAEASRFESALQLAQTGLVELPPSFRGQNTSSRPIPVVPRNAAIVLTFSGNTNLPPDFFTINPSAVQLLEFKGDPAVVEPVDAFRVIPARVLARGKQVIVDTTLLGGEALGGFTSPGLPVSQDLVTANIRLALPARGSASPALFVTQDQVAELNGIDSVGRSSVIRDFRSGNGRDGEAGVLRDLEAPMIVGAIPMGITAVDTANDVVTLNKRLHQMPVRARFPFVDGALSATTGLPLGPAAVPTIVPLRAGDFLEQTVQVVDEDGRTEFVRVRAEILQNLDIGTVRGDPTFPGTGLATDGTQGETAPVVRVKLASVFAGTDSRGNPVAFAANALPEGKDCVLRTIYYENVRFLVGSAAVSDAARRFEYLRIDPAPPRTINGQPVPPGDRIGPASSLSLEFSEPIDVLSVDATDNFLLSDPKLTVADFATQITDPKLATVSVVPARLSDQAGDGTILQLQPPSGFFHMTGQTEAYRFHLLLGELGVRDLAGNPVQILDDVSQPVRNWSLAFRMDPDAGRNLIGWRVYRFEDVDEDGTLPGSVDIFGQYRLLEGRLVGADTLRFNRTADANNLATISRITRGECWDPDGDTLVLPQNPPNNGVLYWQPQMVDTVPGPSVPPVYLPPGAAQPTGLVIEPHQPRGSRMMMRYIEDDFELSYRQPSDFMLDVEQLYWSPFNDNNVLYDVFDRYTMSLSHTDRRPDTHFILVTQPANPPNPPPPPECRFVCASAASSLSRTFAENILPGTQQVTVFEDKAYQVNPNDALRSSFNVKYVPFPRFDRTYTWRDSRLVSVDANGNVTGLGGARDPSAPAPNDDWTASIDSPWIQSNPDAEFVTAGGTTWVMDDGDFRGNRRRDHDPIALPLLVDFKMFPDGAANGIASGANGFQVAMIGPPSAFALGSPGGYYNFVGVGCPGYDAWPLTRVHTTGGIDPNTSANILVDPANSPVATGGFIKDAGAIVMIGAGAAGNGNLGVFQAPPGDGMINWARADFVRKVSSMTFGFIDTLRPNLREVAGTGVEAGFPNFEALSTTLGDLRIADMVAQLDPPQSMQPAGTNVVLEFRGANEFANATLYNPTNNDTFGGRGNLLNSNYACEAYRYSQPNFGQNSDTPRVAADGLTRYVPIDQLQSIRVPSTGLLPRYLNLRLVMTNNVDVSPALSPTLRSMALIYRMQPIQ